MTHKVCTFIFQALVIALLVPAILWGQAASTRGQSGPSSRAQAPNISGQNAAVRPHDDSFIIGTDDLLAINVWKEPDVSRSIPVRSDGKISLPLVGELQAAGQTPAKLEQDIAARLKNYISEPEVTVIVQQINSQKINILGMVNRPGSYVLAGSMTILDAIAQAGGFRDFAKQKSIYVLRQNVDGTQTRLSFNYKEVVKGINAAQNLKLQPRDSIIVP